MRRPSKFTSHKLSADSQRLITCAQGFAQASSRLEERAWEHNLDSLILKTFKGNHQNTIDAALENLFPMQSSAYDALMEAVEAMSESCVIEHEGVKYDVLLVAIPILAWTRFSIASGAVPKDLLTTLSAHLHAHVLAADALMAMAPSLYAIDQLPRSHAEVHALTQQLGQAAIKKEAAHPNANKAETAPFLADTRYLLASVAVPSASPIFRWQTTQNLHDREEALEQWRVQAMPNIARLLPGCGIELLLPEAYYTACREADKQIRPASIRAAVHYLTHTLNIEADKLSAAIGRFGDENLESQIDEYRIGFILRDEVVYGVVWPLYGEEEDAQQALQEDGPSALSAKIDIDQTPLGEILALLAECGISNVKCHPESFAMEFCDDCGAPLYPDMQAELAHAEMPEDAPPTPSHLH